MTDLIGLRADTLEITKVILDKLKKRKKLVQDIQSQKKVSSKEVIQKFLNFDQKRELLIFSQLIELSIYSKKDLFILSLIIEEHAGFDGKYPLWSSGQHLVHCPTRIEEQINPILLFKFFKVEYDSLHLNNEFKELLKFLEIE